MILQTLNEVDVVGASATSLWGIAELILGLTTHSLAVVRIRIGYFANVDPDFMMMTHFISFRFNHIESVP